MQNEIITYTSPKASVSEAFRSLRTNVQFMNVSKNKKSILFTSTQPGDGKSWIAANLAVTFAQAGKKVIIVDTDMRRGRQNQIFDLPNNKGLSNYLILAANDPEEVLGEFIQATMVENLYVITSGIVPPNPSELLTSSKMIDLIQALEKMADIVIFDSTPSTMVTDAMAISRYVGSTIIVASYKKTKMEVLKQIKRNIENVGGKVRGVILNKIPVSKSEYGKSYYYETSLMDPTPKKKWLSNPIKMFNSNIENMVNSGVEQLTIENQENNENEKINEEKNNQESANIKQNNEDEELNILLKQLTKYLETK